MRENLTRREFLRDTAVLGVAAAAVRHAGGLVAAEGAAAQDSGEAKSGAAAKMPRIRLGDLEVSRLILGSNPFFGFAHKPGDVGQKMKEFYTEERVMAVLDEAADQGIMAVWTPCYDHWIELWNRYRERGGKLKIWIGQPDHSPDQMKDAITACAHNGGKAVCIQGERIDAEMRAGRFDVVRGWLEHIKSFGLPAGMASHRPETHLVAEEKGFPTDFYHQCLYQPENYGEDLREKALATIAKLPKPVVAYKVLAAGRVAPAEAFPYVLARLRPKDGLCVGVFPKDKPDQVAENTGLVRKLTPKKPG
jgi:hypothetical protein